MPSKKRSRNARRSDPKTGFAILYSIFSPRQPRRTEDKPSQGQRPVPFESPSKTAGKTQCEPRGGDAQTRIRQQISRRFGVSALFDRQPGLDGKSGKGGEGPEQARHQPRSPRSKKRPHTNPAAKQPTILTTEVPKRKALPGKITALWPRPKAQQRPRRPSDGDGKRSRQRGAHLIGARRGFSCPSRLRLRRARHALFSS